MMSSSRRHQLPVTFGLALLLLFSVPAGMLAAVTGPGTAGTLTINGPDENERDRPNPAFTLNRVRLYIVHACEGQPRVILPPLRGHHSNQVVEEAVSSAVEAVQLIRRQYEWSNIEIVSQSHYLLQAVRNRGGRYLYRLVDEPGWTPYAVEDYSGELRVDPGNGPLAMQVDVLQNRVNVFNVQMQLEPGRPVVMGKRLADGSALFAVLTIDTPDTSPAVREKPKIGHPYSFGPGVTATGTGPAAESSQIFLNWDTPPRLIEQHQPDYPEIAQRAEVEGHVTLHVVVGTDGSVEEVQVADSSPRRIFDGAALEAVKTWRYAPARINSRPVRALFSQTVQFVLHDNTWDIYR
jgi:TonB family protein